VVDLLQALDLGRVVGEILVDGEGEVEGAGLVHALVGLDGEGEVEDVVRVGKAHLHRAAERELLQVWRDASCQRAVSRQKAGQNVDGRKAAYLSARAAARR